MQYNSNKFQARGDVGGFASSIFAASPYTICKKDGSFSINEPISVLDTRSPSPSTSTSTFSSFNTTTQRGNMVVNEPTAAGGGGKAEWVADRQALVHNAGPELSHGVCENPNLGLQDWENLSESAGKQNEILKLILQAGNQNEVQGFLGFSAIDKSSEFPGGSAIPPVGNALLGYNASGLGLSGSGFSFNDHKVKTDLDSNGLLIDNNGSDALQSLAPYIVFQQELENLDQKVEIFNPLGGLNPVPVRNAANQNLNNLLLGTQQEQLKHQNVGSVASNLGSLSIKVPFLDPGHQFLPTKQQHLAQVLQPPASAFHRPDIVPQHRLQEMPVPVLKPSATGSCSEQMGVSIQHQQQQIVYDQVYKAAESMQAGNFSNAQGILARLNHVLAPIGKPFLRSAFYVKEALELAFMIPSQVASVPSRIPAPFDAMFKMGAYKVFSEVSPVIQFMNFTANQIILEALGDAERIHLIDFDIGFGAHWSSFLQELPTKNRGATSVKITAFASPSTHHSLEISLMHENLTQFANDIGLNFELEVVNIDSFDPNCSSISSLRSSESEAIAVNFPVWSFTSYLSALPSYLCLMKKLSPKVLVSLGRGCERIDLPFPHHILQTLQYYEALLDSVDAANVNSDASSKIEKFLFQPRIESTVLGRLMHPDIMPPWRNVFASVGFSPVSISSFTETQAECVMKRMQVNGFHVERRQAALSLYWQRSELVSISAWNC
ncbi:Scarecrow-like protein 6 [Sesamum alatum]|uniref:Scarecrow-like protein 6 n=1 Tax=Sesamum alatum TaxID=300844 RepID=A0AAE2CHZ6_9LAMI|nr:Scarecrow-like protein 6 [Sesamum alatum]